MFRNLRLALLALAMTPGLAGSAVYASSCDVVQRQIIGCSDFIDGGYAACAVGKIPDTGIAICMASKPCEADAQASQASARQACHFRLIDTAGVDAEIPPLAQVILDALGNEAFRLYGREMVGYFVMPSKGGGGPIPRPVPDDAIKPVEEAFARDDYVRVDGGFQRRPDGALEAEFVLDGEQYDGASIYYRFEPLSEGDVQGVFQGDYALRVAELRR